MAQHGNDVVFRLLPFPCEPETFLKRVVTVGVSQRGNWGSERLYVAQESILTAAREFLRFRVLMLQGLR